MRINQSISSNSQHVSLSLNKRLTVYDHFCLKAIFSYLMLFSQVDVYFVFFLLNDFHMLAGNFIAIGSLEPSIEIWDVDIVCELWTLIALVDSW